MNAVVTGANGLVGAHVLLELSRRGHTVTATYRSKNNLEAVAHFFARRDPNGHAYFQKINWLQVDILDLAALEELCEGKEELYHCAGMVSFESRDREKLLKVNERGTANVVQACLLKGLRLCHVSSIAAIHNLDYKEELTEEVYWKKSGQESDYAISKYNAERQVWRGIEEGLQAVIVNPGVILSADFWGRSSTRMMETVYRGNPVYTEGLAAYVAAPDLASIMVELMEKKISGQRFIISEGTYSFKQIFTWMALSLNKRAPTFKIGRGLMRFAAVLDQIRRMLIGGSVKISPEIVNAAYNTQVYSAKKLQTYITFNYLPTIDFIDKSGKSYLADHEK